MPLALCLAASASARVPTVGPPDRSRIDSGPAFHDSVAPRHSSRALRKATLHTASSGGYYPVAGGQTVHVIESDAYTQDDAFNQSWADFFAGLVHRLELSRVTIYFTTYDDMAAQCGGDADACYLPDTQTIVLSGDPLPDGATTESAAAHEYGHHVAEHRRNDLGPAGDWGPEYWATYEEVCWLEDNGRAFPGAEGPNYARNPGEAWAETFRVLNGWDTGSWPIIAPIFRPDLRALALARRDVVNPYAGGEYIDRSGRLRKSGARSRYFTVPVQNDGTVDLRLTGGGSLDADLYVYTADGEHQLGSARRAGHREHFRDTFCGYRKLRVEVYRYSGAGTFKLRATLPFFS